MDLAWRLFVNFALSGFSEKSVLSTEGSKCLMYDPSASISSRRLRSWGRVLDPRQATDENIAKARHAIATRDILRIHQCLPALVHLMCVQITLISQPVREDMTVVDEPSKSMRLLFSSGVHRRVDDGTPQTLCHYGPNCAPGTMIVMEVAEDVVPWLPNTFFVRPHLSRDDSKWGLWSTAPLSFGSPAQQGATVDGTTPNRFATMTAKWSATPATNGDVAEGRWCDVCSRLVPSSAAFIAEVCGHFACLSCVAHCAQRHCRAPDATPLNMPCPHFGCFECFTSIEVRSFVTQSQFAELERTEVRLALRDRVASCPNCSLLFEAVADVLLIGDPLADKLRCPGCNSTFCRLCECAPYHDGRQCLDGGVAPDAPRCRYCGNAATSLQPLTCDSKECEGKGKQSCLVPKRCGHACHGTAGERSCVPCLEEGCCSDAATTMHRADDMCMICYTDSLRDAPCIELDCGHIFHYDCVVSRLEKRWPTARIGFHFFACVLCNQDTSHSLLHRWVEPILQLRAALDGRYAERIRMEQLSAHITDPNSPYFEKPIEYGREKLNYFICSKCDRPYFGGLRECQDVDREEAHREDLMCGGCSSGSAVCNVHGNQFMEWKCKYCCNTAVWFCWGTTHFCELCHAPPRKSVREECPGEETCPLQGRHQPNGVEFAIGCAMCRAQPSGNAK